MKPHLPLRYTLMLVALTLYFVPEVVGQCNVNSQYDKIVSGYHCSIAQKTDGSFATWGSGMSKTGGDLGSPTALDSTVYTNMTGTPLKVAIGGATGPGSQDQAILLTTNGLWAWGKTGAVLKSTLTASASFARITSPTGANSYGLPTGVLPANVAELFATYQTLIVVTTDGNVWVLTQVNQYVEGNGSTGSASNQWKQVKISSGTYLTNVSVVRGQASSSSANAFMALTTTGLVYTWGNSVYLGDGTAVQSKSYATQMTLPAEFTGAVPKMIAITGGTSDSSNARSTYYVLANSGKLYCVGDNRLKQCGNFSSTLTFASWVQAQKTSGNNFTDVNFISAQESSSGYPAVAAITTGGDLYTWGDDNSGLIGRATGGGVASGGWDPGMPNNFTTGVDKAVSCEMGGHTLVFLKVGSSKFCYVGHKTNGSMGDGDVSSTSPSATLTFDCTNTPSVTICGYVPVTPSSVKSHIASDTNRLAGNGSATTYIRIRLRDGSGSYLNVSGGVVTMFASLGTLGTVTDNNDGTYTAQLTSPMTAVATSTSITYYLNGTLGDSTVSINITASGLLPVLWKTYRANRVGEGVTVSWSTIEDAQVEFYRLERSTNGTSWKTVGSKVPAQLLPGTNYYTRTDPEHIATQVYYRIQQTDKDGSSNYSPVLEIGPDGKPVLETISVFPFPASTSFKLGNTTPDKLSRVQVFNMNGTLLKTWSTPQGEYGVSELPKGMYLLKVELKDGGTQQLRLSKN